MQTTTQVDRRGKRPARSRAAWLEEVKRWRSSRTERNHFSKQKTVAKVMRIEGIVARKKRRHKVKTDSRHTECIALDEESEYLLQVPASQEGIVSRTRLR